MSAITSFFSVLYFAVQRCLTNLVKFIPKYFILFDGIVNEIAFLFIYLVYRNTTQF